MDDDIDEIIKIWYQEGRKDMQKEIREWMSKEWYDMHDFDEVFGK